MREPLRDAICHKILLQDVWTFALRVHAFPHRAFWVWALPSVTGADFRLLFEVNESSVIFHALGRVSSSS